MTRRPGTGAQLALRFPLSAEARFDSFVAGPNEELLRRLEGLAGDVPGFAGCFLHGAPGVGRSHLLQAACHACADARGAIYLPVSRAEIVPGMLEGLEGLGLVALDDVEGWIGDPSAEAVLLGLYQGLLAGGGRMLVSAGKPATALACHYGDLGSRLRALPAYAVQALDEAGNAAVLTRLAAARGLALPAPVLDFWLARGSRDLTSLRRDLERLDEAAMAEQRRVTVPLVKQVLGL